MSSPPSSGFSVDGGDYTYRVLVLGADLSLSTLKFLRECYKSRQGYGQTPFI